ncbi:alpha/beta hydrolase [Rhodoferax koreense]|uniref:Alpha/beta hydrolase n=1 Tax=Rhodoferax koreensis TaxID=1842727 RepID=A0A1P8K1M9_9BURK|nr:alpha/beta fold hydrolase [Rhodoferax koreense]APW39851.1 alpha/beta hydrolase [Rhodoferax koreense]
MPIAELRHARIHYEVYGPANGFPLLLLAPGGLRSHVGLWRHTHEGLPRPWPDPTTVFAQDYRVIAIDQRNAGRSTADIGPDDGWHTYAADHLGVLDHLGIDRFHVLGACIGTSFALKLIELAPERVASAVLQQPIGLTAANAPLRLESFEVWARGLRQRQPGLSEARLQALFHHLFGQSDFVYCVSRDFVRRTGTPLLVLPGDDVHHPVEIAEEIAALAPHAEVLPHWKGAANRQAYIDGIGSFLARASQLQHA